MVVLVLRSIGAVLAGLVVAMLLIVAVEGFGAVVHPFPPGVDVTDMEVCKAHVAKCPHWVLGVVVGMWGFTAFASAWIATRLGAGRHPAHGIFVGTILLLAAAMNLFMLPYPIWFRAAILVAFPLAIYWGSKLGRGRTSNPPAAAPEPDASLDSRSRT